MRLVLPRFGLQINSIEFNILANEKELNFVEVEVKLIVPLEKNIHQRNSIVHYLIINIYLFTV